MIVTTNYCTLYKQHSLTYCHAGNTYCSAQVVITEYKYCSNTTTHSSTQVLYGLHWYAYYENKLSPYQRIVVS